MLIPLRHKLLKARSYCKGTERCDGKEFNELIKFTHVTVVTRTTVVYVTRISSTILVGRCPYLGSVSPCTVQHTLHRQMCAVVVKYTHIC